tara:strand:- start:331 stop:2355 length:2025 start_codon:yes stop_codon:yes gene_type:complete
MALPTEIGLVGQDTSAGTPPATPYEKAQVEYKAQIANLSKIQNDLMASLDSRQGAGNPLFALAQGFLAPTRGGGFGESAGNAMQLFGAQQQQEQKQAQETAMMRMQLAQASLAPYKEQMEMARKVSLSNDLKKLLSGEGGQPIKPTEAPDVARSMGIDPLGPAAASLIGRQQPAASNRNNLFNQFDPTTKSLLMSQAAVDPEGVMKELATFGMKESARTDKMKEMTYFADQFPSADRQRLMQFAANRALIGDPSTLINALNSVQQNIDKEVGDPSTNAALKAFIVYQLNPSGFGATAQPNTPSAQPSIPSAQPTAPVSGANSNVEKVTAAAIKYNVPVNLALAVAKQESGLIHQTDKGLTTSPKGAVGLMQLMPDTARDLKVDPSNLDQNIDGGVRYLKQQLDRFGNSRDAAIAYNAGPNSDYFKTGTLLPETRGYLAAINATGGFGNQPESPAASVPVANLTESQRKLRDRQLQDLQTEKNKAAAVDRTRALNNFNESSKDRQSAADVTALVKQSPNMFGVFEKPGYAAAIGGLAENAVRVGNFSIGVPGIRKAVSTLGATQQDIDNLQKVAVIAVTSSLSLAAAAKGSVSNFERELFQQASLSTHDTPNVLLYKADLLRARAAFSSVLWDDFRKFEKANPSANFTDYQDKVGRQLIDRYENQLARIRDNYIR